MSILILGKGFVGTHLYKHLQSLNIQSDIYSQSELEYTDYKTFDAYLKERKGEISAVINCSGYTGVPNVDACEANKELCYNYNVAYPLQVAALCAQHNVPLIHVGSGCIYSGYDKDYTEDDIPNFGVFSDDSSYYSKCKHIFETFAKYFPCYVFRIRIPFTGDSSRKNYFTKLLNYNTLINENNSVTSITDFNEFVIKFLECEKDSLVPHGVYNVVNPEPILAEDVVKMLQAHNLNNPNWVFIETKDLNTKAKRSNCVLSTKKIKTLGLELPPTKESMLRDIAILSKHIS